MTKVSQDTLVSSPEGRLRFALTERIIAFLILGGLGYLIVLPQKLAVTETIAAVDKATTSATIKTLTENIAEIKADMKEVQRDVASMLQTQARVETILKQTSQLKGLTYGPPAP